MKFIADIPVYMTIRFKAADEEHARQILKAMHMSPMEFGSPRSADPFEFEADNGQPFECTGIGTIYTDVESVEEWTAIATADADDE